MRTVSHHGRETAYRRTDFGDGDPILYVHGSGGCHQVWIEQYGPKGVGPAVAVDLTGHGGSDDVPLDPGRETLDAYADDVVAIAAATDARVLAGNSMGGAVAMWVALERDLEFDALILCGTGAKLGVSDDLLGLLATDFGAAVDALDEPEMLFHDAPQETVDQSTAMLHDVGAAVTERDFRTCDAFDVRDRLGEIEVPALAITGEHDGLTPPSFTEYLGERLTRGEAAILADCAHLSMLEEPGAWNDRVREFLA